MIVQVALILNLWWWWVSAGRGGTWKRWRARTRSGRVDVKARGNLMKKHKVKLIGTIFDSELVPQSSVILWSH